MTNKKCFVWPLMILILLIIWITIAVVPAYTQEKQVLRVLFIGDSTTYTNAMPLWVAILGKNLGCVPQVEVKECTRPNTMLRDHLVDKSSTNALQKIHESGWDIVVLQGGAREPLDKPDQFFITTKRFAEEVRSVGAEPIFFQSYAYDEGYAEFETEAFLGGDTVEMQKLDCIAYAKAAEQVGARIARAGDARLWLLKNNPEIKLKAFDKVHPSACGSYLMACIYICLFTGKDPREATWIPTVSVTSIPITEDEAKVLRDIAYRFCGNQEADE